MRIAIIIGELGAGGAERAVRDGCEQEQQQAVDAAKGIEGVAG